MKNIKIQIEIPSNSKIKYEFNRKTQKIEVDRILREDFSYPANYGFIPNTLDWDGDELDVLLYSSEKFFPGTILNARIVGAMKMIDDKETDTKIIAVHADDYRLDNIKTLDQLPKVWLQKIETFFSTYKNWKRPKITSILGFEKTNYALNEYNICLKLMQDYKHLSKKNFIEEMKKLHPEKYE